ncbi:uncharacterized protein LOC134855529 isoform X2 [Symsagittifera roscoffensis]|uniref:uncharacterized protein LOC134855529 isoform X2 n=1 Tax=Symsagittifera roscoffensis TaxID=84072 RepID=UPI00307BF00B
MLFNCSYQFIFGVTFFQKHEFVALLGLGIIEIEVFCYIGFVIDSRQTLRIPHSFDFAQFYQLIRPVHKRINWVSLSRRNAFERGDCCHDQTEIYERFGQRKGVTPLEYFSNVTDFRSRGKKLTLLQSVYNEELCVNIINLVGFGQGGFKLRGGHQEAPYVIRTNSSIDVFIRGTIQRNLSFDWFKSNFICRRQPWICEEFPVYSLLDN